MLRVRQDTDQLKYLEVNIVSSSCKVFLDRGRVLRKVIADNLNVFLITQVDDVHCTRSNSISNSRSNFKSIKSQRVQENLSSGVFV